MREDLLKGLTEEQINKVKECKSPEDILTIAKAEGIELSDEQLEFVSGGYCKETNKYECPRCQSRNCYILRYRERDKIIHLKCLDCENIWMQQEPVKPGSDKKIFDIF
jgi:hypothetical protein